MPDHSQFNIDRTRVSADSSVSSCMPKLLRQIASSLDISKVSWRSSSRAKSMEWPS